MFGLLILIVFISPFSCQTFSWGNDFKSYLRSDVESVAVQKLGEQGYLNEEVEREKKGIGGR
jgi:hypothetical protein